MIGLYSAFPKAFVNEFVKFQLIYDPKDTVKRYSTGANIKAFTDGYYWSIIAVYSEKISNCA